MNADCLAATGGDPSLWSGALVVAGVLAAGAVTLLMMRRRGRKRGAGVATGALLLALVGGLVLTAPPAPAAAASDCEPSSSQPAPVAQPTQQPTPEPTSTPTPTPTSGPEPTPTPTPDPEPTPIELSLTGTLTPTTIPREGVSGSVVLTISNISNPARDSLSPVLLGLTVPIAPGPVGTQATVDLSNLPTGWTGMQMANPTIYRFTYNGAIPANGSLTLPLTATFPPYNGNGSGNMTAILATGTGGDTDMSNNFWSTPVTYPAAG